MPAPLTVHVTPADIAAGVRYDWARCPIALAAGRATGLQVLASRRTLLLLRPGDPPGKLTVPLPEAAVMWAVTWNHDGPDWSAPFTFELDVPEDFRPCQPSASS